MENMIYHVMNRSHSTVVYSIPDTNIRRTFAPNEVKKISYSELEQLTFIPGGSNIIAKYLLVPDPKALENLGIYPEQEYFMTEQEIKDLLIKGSYDMFLDCLDFAPEGVLQVIKDLAVHLPLNDVAKREAIKDKLKFDVSAAIAHEREDKGTEQVSEGPHRRVQPQVSAENEEATIEPVRRVKIIK